MAVLRQDRMSKEERMAALLGRHALDRVPVWGILGTFAGANVGYTTEELFADFTGEKAIQAFEWTTRQYGFQDLPMTGYASLGAWEFGGAIAAPSGEFSQAVTVTRHPATTEEAAWTIELPDVAKAGIIPISMQRSKTLAAAGAPMLMLLLVGSWDVASSICSPEMLCRWALRRPELTHRVLRLATDFLLEVSRLWADSFGPERLLVFSTHAQTSNQVISPKMFQQYCLPYIQETHEKMLGMGYRHFLCHICGEQNMNLPYWAQIPMGDPGIASFGHEVDLETASRYFPDDIIMGNIEPAVIQMGTPQEVYEQARACIERGRKHPGGFMLAPGCEMPPKAPPFNVWTIFRAVSEFGWYE